MSSKQTVFRNRLGIFSVVWIIITSGGVLLNNLKVVPYVLIFDVLLVLVQFSFVGGALYTRYRNQVVVFALLVGCVLMSVIANSDYASFLSYARLLLIILFAMGTSLLLTNEAIAKTFLKAVVILAVISVALFYSELVEHNASFFPSIESNDLTYVNAFVYLHFQSLAQRNLSIFIEPGLYQVYLNVALFILLYSEKKIRYGYIAFIILLLALYSTKSTTGYIVALTIFGGQIFTSKSKNKNIFFLIFKTVAVFMAVGFVLMSDSFSGNVEEKFEGDKSMSFNYRLNATIVDALVILENPLTGIGVGNYKNELENSDLDIEASANTFTQLGAHVGLPFVLLILWRVSVFASHLHTNLIGKSIFFAIYVILFSTEPFVLYPLFFLFVFMSYRDWESRQGVARAI